MGKVNLKLDGRPLDLALPVPPAVEKVKAVLDKAPADELYTRQEMQQKFRISDRALNRAYQAFPTYRATWHGHKTIWGNPKAIKAYLEAQ